MQAADYRTTKRRTRDFIHGVPGAFRPEPLPRLATAQPQTDARAAADGAATPREAWIRWLAPRFPSGSLYLTGTYSDDYGLAHGCTLPRNVHKDFRRWLVENDLQRSEFINGVERHQYRDVLHLHAVLAGDFDAAERERLAASWDVSRGFARALPVLDGCAAYVTKYALKVDTEHFDWNLA